MKLHWSKKALSDLQRLHEFLERGDANAAARTIRALIEAPEVLLANPRIGEPLGQFLPRDVRRILVRRYEIRYEIKNSTIDVLRIWHTKEHR
ncbi:type II toxin-antitoxin system RelE/ParE family toxin [Duganella sp. PWIR1]